MAHSERFLKLMEKYGAKTAVEEDALESPVDDTDDLDVEEIEQEDVPYDYEEFEGPLDDDEATGSEWMKEKAQAFAGGGIGTIEQILRGFEWLGSDTARDLADPLQEIREEYLTPEHQTIANDIAGGFGSMIGFMVPGMTIARIPGMIGKGAQMSVWAIRALETAGIATSTGMEALAEAGSVYKENLLNGKSEQESNQNAFETFMYNAALLGFTNKVSGFFRAGKSLVSGIGRGFATEGAQEGLQSVISQYETGQEIDLNQAGYEAFIGGIVGGGMGGVTSVIDKKAIPHVEDGIPGQKDDKLDVDSDSFNRGMDQGQTDNDLDVVRMEDIIKQGQVKAQERIDSEEEFKQVEEENKYQERVAYEKNEAKFTEARNEKEEQEQFMDSIKSKDGLLTTASQLIIPLENSENPQDKMAARPIRDAHKAIFVGDFATRKIKAIQYDLQQLAQSTENKYVGAVASGLQNQLDVEMNIASEREAQIEQEKIRNKELETEQKQADLKSKVKTTEAKKTAKATKEKVETKARVTKRAPEKLAARKELEKAPVRTKAEQAKISATQRAKKGAERRIEAEKVEPMPRLQAMKNKKLIQDAKKKIEKGIRYAKQPVDKAVIATDEVNKSSGETIVKFDGPWPGVGMQFTTQQQIGTMEKGQTFIVGKEVTPKTIKEGMDTLLKNHGVAANKNPIRFKKAKAPDVFYSKQYTVEETGDVVKVKINATKALTAVESDLFSLKVLRDCI